MPMRSASYYLELFMTRVCTFALFIAAAIAAAAIAGVEGRSTAPAAKIDHGAPLAGKFGARGYVKLGGGGDAHLRVVDNAPLVGQLVYGRRPNDERLRLNRLTTDGKPDTTFGGGDGKYSVDCRRQITPKSFVAQMDKAPNSWCLLAAYDVDPTGHAVMLVRGGYNGGPTSANSRTVMLRFDRTGTKIEQRTVLPEIIDGRTEHTPMAFYSDGTAIVADGSWCGAPRFFLVAPDGTIGAATELQDGEYTCAGSNATLGLEVIDDVAYAIQAWGMERVDRAGMTLTRQKPFAKVTVPYDAEDSFGPIETLVTNPVDGHIAVIDGSGGKRRLRIVGADGTKVVPLPSKLSIHEASLIPGGVVLWGLTDKRPASNSFYPRQTASIAVGLDGSVLWKRVASETVRDVDIPFASDATAASVPGGGTRVYALGDGPRVFALRP